jgi:hypothetical protein
MTSSIRFSIVVIWVCALACLNVSWPTPQTTAPRAARQIVVPKIWDAKELATWAVPIAGVKATPHFYSEEEYYAAPVENLRTYPVYHPDREPKGYQAWLKRQGAQPLVEPEKLKTEKDWINAGRRVFDELDVPLSRTSDERVVRYLRDREAIKRDSLQMTKDGILPQFRWVVEKSGELKVALPECSACHTRVMTDGSVIRGAQGNLKLNGEGMGLMVGNLINTIGGSLNELEYRSYAVPWLKDDIHERFKTMSAEEINEVDGPPLPGTFARFNGSPYYITKIPDLIGIKDQRYLDHTGTHFNRGPADIARYAALVAYADDGAIGQYKFLTEEQRRLPYRFTDEALFALGKFIYSLEPPPNPNKLTSLAGQGQKVFNQAGCAVCHTPPLYTNNALIPVDGFEPPKNDPVTARLEVFNFRVGTDPNLALKTRKGTGYYKVPSLKGLWYRGLIEHSGSIASLDEWFDPKRLGEIYVPSGWKGPGVKTRAVKGHEFGLNLSDADKRALIAFLKTL